MVRSAARPVRLDDIVSTAFEDDTSLLGPTLRGHLAIEALLVELIAIAEPGDKTWRLSFPGKTDRAVALGLLPAYLKPPLDRFNDFRNDFAHVFGFCVGITDVHRLARDLEQDGVDFSDSVGHQPIGDAAVSYGGEAGVLYEILWCLAFEVAHQLMEKGGRDLFAA